MTATIRPCTVADFEHSPFFMEILTAYGQESSIPEIGKVSPNMAMYRALEASGVLSFTGVFVNQDLVGIAALLVYEVPHYSGGKVATMESLFVLPAYRRGGTGLKLLKAVEENAKERGASALLVSAPAQGRLAKVLERSRYRETNRVFTLGLA